MPHSKKHSLQSFYDCYRRYVIALPVYYFSLWFLFFSTYIICVLDPIYSSQNITDIIYSNLDKQRIIIAINITEVNEQKMAMIPRTVPNILLTGTPGVGKSTISRKLADRTKYIWREVSKLAEEHNCLDEYDPEYQCPYLNEDKLLDIMEGMMAKGGNIVDYHGCELFPERWFDGVFVIRTNNTTLYDRLAARGYTGKKLEDNIQCEIFETLLEEANSSYKEEIVQELQNDTEDHVETNVDTIVAWIERWKEENL